MAPSGLYARLCHAFLVVCMLYSQLCNNYSDKSNRWNLGVSLSVASTAVGAISSSPSSFWLIPPITACRDEIFSKSTVAHTTRCSAMAEGLATRLSVEILQLQNIPFKN